jgi:hypothetical protein
MGCDFAILEISDGTTTINLIDELTEFCLSEWNPSIAEPKDGGVWRDSPLADGRQLAMRKFANATETMTLQVRGYTQDDVIEATQDLRRLLEKAVSYWTTKWQKEPVWIHALSANEANDRYAVICDYRTPSDSYPYCEPMCAGISNPGMIDWPMVLERGHWQADEPGSATCVQLSTQRGPNRVLNSGFEVAGAGGADVFANWNEVAVAGAITDELVNVRAGAHACAATVGAIQYGTYVLQTVAVTAGVTYFFEFWTRGDGTDDGVYRVADNAAVVPDLIAHTHTGITGTTYTLVSNTITIPAGVTAVDIYLYAPDPGAAGTAYYDDVYFGLESVRAATCSDEIYVANKHNRAQLSHIFHYTAIGPVWSANLIAAALPFALLPAAPAIGDIVYFGIDMALFDSGPFCSLVFDIGTASVAGMTGDWEYYSTAGGGTWVALTVQDNTDNDGAMGGVAFNTTGVGSVHWTQPSTWTTVAVNGTTGYWVRFVVTAGAVAPPTQQNRQVYSAVVPYVQIDDVQVGGDIAALSRTLIDNVSDKIGAVGLDSDRAIMGLRSISRGANFTAFINLCDEQNETGVVAAAVVASSTSIVAYVQSATGRSACYNPGGAQAIGARVVITFSSAISNQFRGKYHAFIRVTQDGGVAGDFSLRLRAEFGGLQTLDAVSTTTAATLPYGYELVDLGFLDIQRENIATLGGYCYLFIDAANSNAAPGDLYMHDLILMPVDEFAIDTIHADSSIFVENNSQTYLDIDSVTLPRTSIKSILRYDADDTAVTEWLEITSSPAILQANRDQRLWFLMDNVDANSSVEISNKMQMFATWRYLSMRGSR